MQNLVLILGIRAFGVELFGVIGRKGWKAVGFLKYLGFGVKIAKN